jgi:cystathionine gamma-synthase
VVLADGVYGGVRSLVQSVFGAWGVVATFVDQTDVRAVRAALQARPTQLLWLESPSNPMWQLADIAACAAEARAVGARIVVDNTVATPLLQQPLALGADVVLHATTKYIGGHSDVTGGALVVPSSGPLLERIRELQKLAGAVPSPFDCWLLLRGLRTLAVRVERQSASALAVAELLATLPRVTAVHYPWLSSHPQAALAQRQMRAGGGMVSFEVAGGAAAAIGVAGRLQLFARATSLGGVESLVEHRKTVEPADTPTPDGLLRLSIGLEHVDDLRADLTRALAG